MKFPVVVSFYTKNTPYEQEVQALIASCKRFDLSFSIDGIDSFGSWELNCAFKPFFLYQKLQELNTPLLWVDADAVFVAKPAALQEFSGDLAVRLNEELADDHPSKVMSGTVYVNNTSRSQELLRRWAQECVKELMREGRTEEFWEQTALRDILLAKDLKIDLRSLPLSYVKIPGHPLDEKNILSPIIEHHQASRRFKKIVNKVN
ncbi:MAG: putative nucleotide-diphospho-sugar transferase [Chlamydiales bacterium]